MIKVYQRHYTPEKAVDAVVDKVRELMLVETPPSKDETFDAYLWVTSEDIGQRVINLLSDFCACEEMPEKPQQEAAQLLKDMRAMIKDVWVPK